jgi:hypothetical protein
MKFSCFRSGRRAAGLLTLLLSALPLGAQQTQIQYLSGKGPKDAREWDFLVTAGRRSGTWTKIAVPSNWEQQGFGSYNYGQEFTKSDERGQYRLRFTAPPDWKGRRVHLVFEGVMTDTAVKVNGHSAGPIHQGGFYRFRYDVTQLLKLGDENLLEVEVSKVSANPDTESAERGGDYWVFGGIYRPVYLEAVPAQWIENTAIDARADGNFTADVTLGAARTADRVDAQILNAAGQPTGPAFSTPIPGGGTGLVRLATHIDSPRLWTAETPNLYTLRLTLRQGDTVIHSIDQRFGFRTFEIREGKGLFLNGQRILLKGVGRHSFRPETGRALTTEDNYEDVRTIKSMNMNAVRMTHYPPDVAFLEACDELGLYVLDELSGWHHFHSTEVGRRLVREMVTRDVNHPSILFWDNGNEGGFNRDLDSEFVLYDPQHRKVLHPWEAFNGIDTKHYPTFDDLERRLAGPNLVMPTEMIHGIYDGGAGAALEDYWRAISHSPYGAGGFIWVYADEGIVRTDQDGRIDVFSTFAPDGILGPHHEREGSYYTIRDIYSPVQIEGDILKSPELTLHNLYDFTSLDQCQLTWKLLGFHGPKEAAPTIQGQGTVTLPAVAPHQRGKFSLPLQDGWISADALAIAVTGPDQQVVWNWVWKAPSIQASVLTVGPKLFVPQLTKSANEIRLIAGDVSATFDPKTGLLREVRNGNHTLGLANGPRLAFEHPPTANDVEWLVASPQFTSSATDPAFTVTLPSPHLANQVEINADYPRTLAWIGYRLEISPDGQTWKTIYDATRRGGDGRLYSFPPQTVAAVRVAHFRRSDGQPVALRSVRVGYSAARFPAPSTTPATITTGSGKDGAWIEAASSAGLTRFRWTLAPDRSLRLNYDYKAEGEFEYLGITFDYPEEKLRSFRWLGQGPYRVWQNRLRGTWLGVHEIQRNEIQPGESWNYPESQGYFAGLRWVRFENPDGNFSVTAAQPDTYLRIGTPRFSLLNTSPDFPAGGLSFLDIIPPIGSKFVAPEKSGPASQWTKNSTTRSGSLVFYFE